MSREPETNASRGDSEAKPFPKAAQLARGERRYRRRVASPKQWQGIIEAKRAPCRVRPEYVLQSACPACNREPSTLACDMCSEIEHAETRAGNVGSPQLYALDGSEYHHLLSRAQGGDDTVDNIVCLSREGHALVTARQPEALRRLAESLSDAEYAYLIGKLGEGALERLYGVGR